MNILRDDDSHLDESRNKSRRSRSKSRSRSRIKSKLPNIGLTNSILYIFLIIIFYIITKRHYDVKGTTITVKKLDNPLDIKSLEDMSIVPVFNEDEYALMKPLEELFKVKYDPSYYIELDGHDRISGLCSWDSYLDFTGEYGSGLRGLNEQGKFKPDKFRISKTPQKQLEYGKIVGLDDLKVVKYDKHKINTLDTTPIEVGYLNDILNQVIPSLKKFYKDGLPDAFVMNFLDVKISSFETWLAGGLFHQDAIDKGMTIRRPYTRSSAKHRVRDIRMIILDPESIGDLTEFAEMIGEKTPSHKNLDDYIDGLGNVGSYSTQLPIEVIKLDKSGKHIIGILFDNHEIFHSVPRTSLSLFEYLIKNSGFRKIYQIGFSDGFFGPKTAAAKNPSKKKKHTKKKKKSKKYKVKFEK